MSNSTPHESALIGNAAHDRLTPSLPADSAHLLCLKHTPGVGFGLVATSSMKAHTPLLESKSPAVYVIYREFRKEVCAWCFRYECGLNWKFRFNARENSNSSSTSVDSGYSGSGGIAFCSEDCKEAWRKEYGDRAVGAYAAVEGFVQKQARSKKQWTANDDEDCGEEDLKVPDTESIEENNSLQLLYTNWLQIWQAAEEKAKLIRTLRRAPVNNSSPTSSVSSYSSNAKSPYKLAKQALTEVLNSPILSVEMAFFLLSGILCASSSNWHALLALKPSPEKLYLSRNALQQVTRTFLHLTAIIPPSLLAYVTRSTLEAVIARDIGNSFGIWSMNPEPKSSSPSPDHNMEDGGSEMLGYGIWTSVSFCNHSCAPNLSRRRVGRSWIFSSARDIAEGEELCISYIRGDEEVLHLQDRRKRLSNGWGFVCQCQKCVSEEEEDDETIEE